MLQNISMTVGPTGGLLAFVWLVFTIIVHVLFALGVYKFAKQGDGSSRQTWLVGPFVWSLTTLVLGPFFAAVYWLVHHSSMGGFSDHPLKALQNRRADVAKQAS